MVAHVESGDRDPEMLKTVTALETLARSLATLWRTTTGEKVADACAQIDGDRLVFTAPVLTPDQVTQAASEEGRDRVRKEVTDVVDQLYPALADAIERHLHCYVGAMHVELDLEHCAALVQFQLRDAPGLWKMAQSAARC